MKAIKSKLDQYAELLDEWFTPASEGGKGMTLDQARDRLAVGPSGLPPISVSVSRLSDWWTARRRAKQEDLLLQQIATGAKQCRDVEAQFSENPAPELETIIKLHRVLILKLSTQANVDPEMLELVARLTKPTMEYAKLMEKRREMELKEAKYRDMVNERKLAIEAELSKAKSSGGISTETLHLIEKELKLL